MRAYLYRRDVRTPVLLIVSGVVAVGTWPSRTMFSSPIMYCWATICGRRSLHQEIPRKEKSAMSAARVIPFPQTARSQAKQLESRGMVLLLGGLLTLLVGVAAGMFLGRRWPVSNPPHDIAGVVGYQS